MEHPSPTKYGFDPNTKKWLTEYGKDNYRKAVTAYAKYVTYNQKKITMKRKDMIDSENSETCNQHPETCSNPFCRIHS